MAAFTTRRMSSPILRRMGGVTPCTRPSSARVRPPAGELEEGLVPDDLERRPVERPRPILPGHPEAPEHRTARVVEVARAAHAPPALRVEHLLPRLRGGNALELAPGLPQPAGPLQLARELVAQRQEVARVERGVRELVRLERAPAPVRALEGLGEPHAEARLDEGREAEGRAPQAAGGGHRVEQAGEPPPVLAPQAADVVVGAVQDHLAPVAEHLAERPGIDGQGVDDPVARARRELQQADPLAVDVEAVGLAVERQEGLLPQPGDQIGEGAGVGDERRSRSGGGHRSILARPAGAAASRFRGAGCGKKPPPSDEARGSPR